MKVAVIGYPFCLYPKYTEESMDFVCAFPVAADTKVPSKYITNDQLPILKSDNVNT